MEFSTDKFVGAVVTVTVAVIIFSMVAVPIIANAMEGITGDNADQLKAIMGVIPIFMVIGILLACIWMFLGKKA